MAKANRLDPIPHPPRKPLVGNMLSVDPSAPVADLMRYSRELGPIFWLDMIGAPIVFVSGAALVGELSDEKRFDKTVRGALRRLRAIGGDGLFTGDTTEPNWSKAHNILMAPFGNRAMTSYHPMMVDIAEQLVKKWERLNADDEINVVHDMTALTLDTIGLCGFDYRFNSFYREDYHPFVEALARSMETVMMTRGLPLENLTMRRRRSEMEADLAFMYKMVDEIVRERRRNAEAAAGKMDLLGAMMTGADRTSGERLDDINIRYQINTFLIAGHETTSGMLSCAIYAIMKDPAILRKAYDEVDRVLGADLAARPTYQQVTQLTYLSQILKEALRLWPPLPVISVTPLKDEVIGGKYRLRKGTFINILTTALHRDPSVWGDNPEVFDPDRFSREAEATRSVHAWKPFGNGQRACIGRGFAMHEAALALGMILQRFKFVDHTGYEMVLKESLTIKPDGFKIKVRLRADFDRNVPAARATKTSTSDKTSALAPAVPSSRPTHGTPLLVLYGSNLGTGEELATQIADLSDINGFQTDLGVLDDYVGKLPAKGAVIIVCASYNGAPPDNAAAFVKWLESDLPHDTLAGVRYAVFGCGNSDWHATYQSVPRFIDERLAALGAKPGYQRGEGDARQDLQGQFESWFAALRNIAAQELGLDGKFDRDGSGTPLYDIEAVTLAALHSLVGSGTARAMKVLVNRELQTRTGPHASGRSTRHIELALPEGVTYRTGDHLSVVPRNDPGLVEQVARHFGFAVTDQIKLRIAPGRRSQLPVNEPISIGRLLGECVELQQIATPKNIQAVAAVTRCPMTKSKLAALAGDSGSSTEHYRTHVLHKRKSVFDLLREYPASESTFAGYLEMLSPLSPRYYSISSAPRVDQSRCSITVGVVEGEALSGQGIFRGVASNYLARSAPGETIHAIVRETKAGFRLPDDPTVPVIMIGPGTGLAPFRGFLQERAARKVEGAALGPAMLFFGCRHPDQDYIYADELQGFASQNVVQLHVGFSRAEGTKTYVQHLIAANKDRVWALIDTGAIVFVCGDGEKMEPDVRAELMSLYRERTGAGAGEALRWIEEMGSSGRYVLDVWSGNLK